MYIRFSFPFILPRWAKIHRKLFLKKSQISSVKCQNGLICVPKLMLLFWTVFQVDNQGNAARKAQRSNDELQAQVESLQVQVSHLQSRYIFVNVGLVTV